MMVLCFLMSIPLKMMAQDKVEVVSHYKQGDVWKENTNFDLTKTDGEIYTWVLKDVPEAEANRGIFFRIKVGSTEYGPQQDAAKDLTLTSSYQKIYQIAWQHPKALKIEATSGTSYTITYNHKTQEIKYEVSGGSIDVTKEIKLLNGTSELTGSNGKYTLDLSGETSDAKITLTIDGAKYGLATAQTISAVGITSDIAFTEGASEVLTLKTGFVYTLIVAEDGKMKVVARQRGAADGIYYLVGNFFNEDGENINYDKKYFRFINNKGDGNLYFDIPASLTVKAQVYGADGKCYGPKDNKKIGIDKPASTDDVTANGEMVAGKDNYWSFTDRGFVEGKKQVGIYRVTIKVDEETGVPSTWNITYDKTKRMAYFLVDPDEDIDAVAQPCYTDYLPKENPDKKWSNNFYGNIYLEAGQHCFVVGNIQSRQMMLSKKNLLILQQNCICKEMMA